MAVSFAKKRIIITRWTAVLMPMSENVTAGMRLALYSTLTGMMKKNMALVWVNRCFELLSTP